MRLFQDMQIRSGRPGVRGFTLVEMMMTVVIFLFIFTGVMIAVQLFGLRVYTLAATKLVATAGGRKALDQIRDQIREGKIVYVGNCSSPTNASFTFLGSTNTQQGNALIVYPTTNATYYTVFYLDTSTPTNCLNQFNVSNGVTTYSVTLAKYLTTNPPVFDAEDYLGNIATSTNYNNNTLDNRLVIKVTMNFSQWEYPIGIIGGVGYNAYDYYQLRTRVFRRAWN